MTVTTRQSSPLACPPLYGTPRSLERETLGAPIGEAARLLGKPLLPWEQHVVDVAGEIDPDTGLLAYSEVVLIAMRQQGKSEILLPVMTHRCIGFEHAGPQTVMYTAQTGDDARHKWRDVHLPRLQKAPRIRKLVSPRLTYSSEAFIWRNGSIWMPGNTTAKGGGTGDSLDLAVIDEAWSRPDNRTELGMRPAMLTRPWRQLWVCSMIPGLSRAMPGTWPYLSHKRQVGRARVEAGMRTGTAFFDFSAADGMDPGDPATWWSCMPSLGHMISEKAVAEDFDAMGLVDFCAEYLGWAPMESTPRWTLIREQTWSDLCDPGSTVAGRPALAVEMAEDRSRGVIGLAGRRADRNWHVAVAEPGYRIAADATGVEWMLTRVLELVKESDACTVVIDPRRPAASLIVPLRNRGVDVLTPNQQDIAGACGRFYDATGEAAASDDAPVDPTRVYHLGQAGLARALGGARKLELGGGAFMLVKKGTADELIDLYAVILAMHGVDVKGDDTVPEPDIFI